MLMLAKEFQLIKECVCLYVWGLMSSLNTGMAALCYEDFLPPRDSITTRRQYRADIA